MKSQTSSAYPSAPRERILKAAHTLFYGAGIRATGVDRVIAEACVSKVTFYRQYASKDDLIRAYLDYRHGLWISWFKASLTRDIGTGLGAPDALAATLKNWFSQPDFRGCAFLNAAAELGSSEPQVLETVRQHKRAMALVLDELFGSDTGAKGEMLSLLIDGAIVHAQMGRPTDEVVGALHASIKALCRPDV
jgi:AcrR family transcriptional regulator